MPDGTVATLVVEKPGADVAKRADPAVRNAALAIGTYGYHAVSRANAKPPVRLGRGMKTTAAPDKKNDRLW